METCLDCLPCFLRQALEASRMATEDEDLQETALKAVLSELGKTSIKNKIPTQLARKVHRIVRKVTKNNNPYAKVKDEYNRKALKMYPRLKQKVARSKDRLLTATKLAIAGNIIDFGPSSKFNLDEAIEDALKKDFAINHFNRFKKALKSSKKIIYLGDNAGEIVFDRILLEEIKGKKVSFVVKGGPIINDATIEDANFVGIDKIAKIEVVSNGDPGTGPDRLSRKFIRKLKDADLVISKGQGNYEALSEVDANIFFLLKAKCRLIARDIGVSVGSTIIK